MADSASFPEHVALAASRTALSFTACKRCQSDLPLQSQCDLRREQYPTPSALLWIIQFLGARFRQRRWD